MPNYIQGILTAFVEPVLHGWCNVLDSYFSNRVFPRLSVLVFAGAVFGLLLLPIVFLFEVPQSMPLWAVGVVFLITFIEVIYVFPYYWSLRKTDTSVVASLFSLGKILVPVLAYFIADERLADIQYAGFALIIVSATLLNLEVRKFKLNPAFFLMLGVSVVLAVQTTLYKYVFESGVSWVTVLTAMAIFQVVISGAILLTTSSITSFKADIKLLMKNKKVFLIQELLNWGGNLGDVYTVSVLPVTVARGISSTQPFFVLLYALILGRRMPGLFKEYLGWQDVTKKSILFLCIIAGTILIVLGGASTL